MRDGVLRRLAAVLVFICAWAALQTVRGPLATGMAWSMPDALKPPGASVEARKSPPSVRFLDASAPRTFSVPGGMLFLPAVVLAWRWPRRASWVACWGILAVLGAVDFVWILFAGHGTAIFEPVHAFWGAYVVRPASLMLPLAWPLFARRSVQRPRAPASIPEHTEVRAEP